MPGHLYSVHHAPVLATGAWQVVSGLSSIQPTGSTMTAQVPVSAPQGYYQVRKDASCCANNGGSTMLSAVNLGSVCGDSAGAPITTSGCGPAWFRVTVSECVASSFINPRAQVALTSPSGANYDLFLHNPGGGVITSSIQPAGVVDSLCVRRTDMSGDQSFELIIEVRRVRAFGCSNWTLDVRGAQGSDCNEL